MGPGQRSGSQSSSATAVLAEAVAGAHFQESTRETGGTIRCGTWIPEATHLVEICRRDRTKPGLILPKNTETSAQPTSPEQRQAKATRLRAAVPRI